MVTPHRPRAPAARMTSSGNWPVSSMALARGATTSRANSSTDCLKTSCAGESSRRILVVRRRARQEPFEDRPQALGRIAQIFRKHTRAADDGQEVGGSRPPRHEMDVNLIDDARARRTSEVHATVDAVLLVVVG